MLVNRSQWIDLLEAAVQARPDQMDAEWRWLLADLDLPLEVFPSILEAIKQGRWRNAKNPKAYIKTVARREFRKTEAQHADLGVLELVNGPQEDDGVFSMEETLELLGHESDTCEARKGGDGVWRRGGGRKVSRYEDEYDEDDHAPCSYRDRLITELPAELKHTVEPSPEYIALLERLNEEMTDYHLHARPGVRLDWEAWMDRAGFDCFDKEVLQCRLQGISRDRALAGQPDEESRKAIQSAWRKFDRNGFLRLKEAAKKNVPAKCPERAESRH